MRIILEPYRAAPSKGGRLELRAAVYADDGRVLALREVSQSQEIPGIGRLFELGQECLQAFLEDRHNEPGYTWADGSKDTPLEAARPFPEPTLIVRA